MMRSEMALWPHPAQSVVLPPFIFEDGQADAVGLWSRVEWVVAIYLPSMVMTSSVTERASSGSP